MHDADTEDQFGESGGFEHCSMMRSGSSLTVMGRFNAGLLSVKVPAGVVNAIHQWNHCVANGCHAIAIVVSNQCRILRSPRGGRGHGAGPHDVSWLHLRSIRSCNVEMIHGIFTGR